MRSHHRQCLCIGHPITYNVYEIQSQVMFTFMFPPGGGYAEYVAVPEDLLLPVPPDMSLVTAAGIPEVWMTAYQLLHFVGRY